MFQARRSEYQILADMIALLQSRGGGGAYYAHLIDIDLSPPIFLRFRGLCGEHSLFENQSGWNTK